ncbi:peptidase M4 family protein [Macrococcus brunensis]|uniref:Neutral metalloproteinase n=1 Tax=Macrococcus brunensis TaxID=198483 RepID=A0A4V3BDN1_9STAP|nr:M4 family metallopeptidase [Macrococcus brunensis]TDL99056.1 peptidase M4 family protein [Macrococcus brunensis]
MLKKVIIATALTSIALTPLQVNALTTSIKVHSNKEAKLALRNSVDTTGISKYYQNYEVVSTVKDAAGFTHYTLQPKAKGYFAEDKAIKVHADSEGNVVLINGETDAKPVKATNDIKISQDTAINEALKVLGIHPQNASNLGNNIVQSVSAEIDGDLNKLIYKIELSTITPKIGRYIVNVDAENGKVLSTVNLVQHAATTGLGYGVLNNVKTIQINSITGGYALHDVTQVGGIGTYSFNDSTRQATLITDPDKTFSNSEQKAGVDAHYYAGKFYQYFKSKFNRESYDNQGSNILSLVHVNTLNTTNDNCNNATWLGDKIAYGDGDGTKYRALSGANDVVAHELMHGVTDHTAGLEYTNQPGALNESMSDVFAYFLDSADWTIAEDVYTPSQSGDALRSLSNPEQYGQPSTMSGYVNTTADNGGIHANSGIPNKAAYLTIQAIGKDKAEQVYYRALNYYITPTSDFSGARKALVQSATDLYGQTTADAIAQAWTKVGVQ